MRMKKILSSLLMAGAAALLMPSAVAQTPPRAPAAGSTASQPAAAKLDLNSATAAELETLKGIGPARSAAIIAGRPYRGKDDLVRRKIVPQSVYDDISELIVARQK